MSALVHDTYRRLALTGMRRCLSRLDRRPWSPTYGCFDREYWHYKTVTEFPRANFQQCVWALALLYKTPFAGNEFARNAMVLDWIRAALMFWVSMRHRDGSVDEWYVNERSFCATAFNTAAVAEALLLIGDELDRHTRATVEAAAQHSADWIVAHPNWTAANQVMAALVALNALGHPQADLWKEKVLALQNEEGWFPEYGGADFGYSLLALDLLAHVWKRDGDDSIKQTADRLVEFITWFVQPDGIVGGDGGSRGTVHGFMYGLEQLETRDILAVIRPALQAGRLPDVTTTDDTYASYFYINSTCLAACLPALCDGIQSPSLPTQVSCKHFPRAGFVSYRSREYHAVISTNRGVWRMCSRDGFRSGDAGYVVVTDNGERWASSHAVPPARCQVTHDALSVTIQIKKPFGVMDCDIPLARWVVPFKLVANWMLGVSWLRDWLTRRIKKRKVLTALKAPMEVTRTWHVTPASIVLEDELTRSAARQLVALYRPMAAAGPHSPSSQLVGAMAADLDGSPNLKSDLDRLQREGAAVLRQEMKP